MGWGWFGWWPIIFSDSPEAKFPFPFFDLILWDLGLGLWPGTWPRAFLGKLKNSIIGILKYFRLALKYEFIEWKIKYVNCQ